MQVLTGMVCDKAGATVQDQGVIFILTGDNYLLPVVYRKERKIVICFRGEVLRQNNRVPVLLKVSTSLCLYPTVSPILIGGAPGGLLLDLLQHRKAEARPM